MLCCSLPAGAGGRSVEVVEALLLGAALRDASVLPRLLLETTRSGCTALHFACWTGNEAVVGCLLEAATSVSCEGALVNLADGNGQSALHYAARQGSEQHAAVIKVLLATPGINANARNKGNLSALELAEAYGKDSAAKVLGDLAMTGTVVLDAVRWRSRAQKKGTKAAAAATARGGESRADGGDSGATSPTSEPFESASAGEASRSELQRQVHEREIEALKASHADSLRENDAAISELRAEAQARRQQALEAEAERQVAEMERNMGPQPSEEEVAWLLGLTERLKER